MFVLRTCLLGLWLSAAGMAASAVNQTWSGVAVKGTDVVAYFTEGKAVAGEKNYTVDWAGATWRFASAEHRDLFKANPEKYAPQYGGYCAYAVSEGYTAGIEPDAWKIVEGRLFLNYNRKVQSTWAKDMEKRIAQADQNWPELHEPTPKS